ncbi:helix-turn-helix domain-containing protein [Sporosarcina sp. GW1-11]|uniref:helix-turn-helix domain-containing protein n=1 Tax=Sporosarcina sp. GW1-11 TaxID=2899126 RepID=UPI003985D081
MSYTYLTISDQVKIETLLKLDYSIRENAKLLHRAPSTISRELKEVIENQLEKTWSPEKNYRAFVSSCPQFQNYLSLDMTVY